MSMSVNNTEMPVERPDLPAGAVWQDDGSVKYVLGQTVTLADRSLPELTLRPLTAGDLIDASDKATKSASVLFLIKRAAGFEDLVSEKLIRAMAASDYLVVQEIIGIFTQPGRRTG